MSDRWPESISTHVASMRRARNRWSSAEVVRSREVMAYHDGLDVHAAAATLSLKSFSVIRPWAAYRTRAVAGSTPFAKSWRKASSVSPPNPSLKTRPALAGGVGNRLASAA
jgi:hypothetical protein